MSPVMVPNRRFSRVLLPSASSVIRHAAIVFLCTSRPQQLRWTLLALLLHHRRRRLHLKNLPFELSSRRCHFVVPTASSTKLLKRAQLSAPLASSGSVACGAVILHPIANIFMRRCDRKRSWPADFVHNRGTLL